MPRPPSASLPPPWLPCPAAAYAPSAPYAFSSSSPALLSHRVHAVARSSSLAAPSVSFPRHCCSLPLPPPLRFAYPPASSAPHALRRPLRLLSAPCRKIDVESGATRGELAALLQEKRLALDGEVEAPRADIAVLLEEKRLALEGQLRRLNARSDDLSDALHGLRWMEFFRKGRVSEVLE